MKMHAVLCATMAGPALAEVVSCELAGVPIQFEIDRTQLAPAVDMNEPTQRRVTIVRMGEAQFPAEPIVMGEVRGFWAEGMGGADIMLVMQPDGTAVYANPRAGERLTGTCEVLQ